ncbi:MAG TPA: hypothetical protein VFZ77_18900 [Acidimicrobiales bacterium]
MADVAESIEGSARRIGGHTWLEMRLFGILGGWSGTVGEPRSRALLAATSRHHAWHAELWRDLLPDLPHLPADDLVAPDDAGAGIVARLEAVDAGEGAATLAAVREVALPGLAARYAAHLARTAPLADGPTIRVLHLVLADVERDRAAVDPLPTAAGGVAPAPG